MVIEQESLFHDLMVKLDMEMVKEETKKALEAEVSPQLIIDGLSSGMEDVGNKFAQGEFFLSELIWAGEIMKEAMVLLEPHYKAVDRNYVGRVVIATVEGDLHDIGKNIAISMLRSAGFDVIDLGVDVPAERILEKALENKADIVALSALLSIVQPYLEDAVRTMRSSNSGKKLKILLGGRIVDDEKAREMGADAYAKDAWDGVAKAKTLMSKKTE
ncbi:MAG: cobalamin-dependent protein [Candidatus Bathyarchaeia archaeon]|jgi:5-methyltetrahydrofolate--homocysteine methyltransferase